MKVEVVSPFGFCAGVEFAIKKAKEIKNKYQEAHVVILGKLVHNEDALNDLRKENIDIIYEKGKTYYELIDLLKGDEIVILTAHGHEKRVEEELKRRNITFYDTTCPFVKKIHEIIEKELQNKHEVLYIGKANHPEALAAISLNKEKVHLVENPNSEVSLKDESPLICSQTTLSAYEIQDTIVSLKEKFPLVRETKTICNASTLRQDAIKNISADTDLIIILGSTYSNNTLTLFNLAKKTHPQSEVIMIENKEQFDTKFLLNKKKVAIASGASTSKDIVLALKDYIESLN